MALQFLLNTNTCIYIINQRPPQVAQRFAQHPPDAVALSSITLAELRYGVKKSGSERNAEVLEAFLAPLDVLPFDAAATAHYAELRMALEKQGTPIGAMDMLIAAHALALGVAVVTHNTREFGQVDGLRVETWF